ncbi:MAG: GTPase ObgE, partial [Calditrichia bacterium]
GGSGASSFRREKHVPKGGPDGGDGGRGGSIILQVDPHLRTLVDFRYKKHYVARHGQHGMGKKKYGKAADDIIVRVPAGTTVNEADSERFLADLLKPGEEFVAAAGGKGGRGNAHFATPTHQAPREWEVGEPGEERWLILELKLIADVGLVGKPNAGKSTLLSRLSAARPKIAEYPFTTLQPNLGIVRIDESRSFVMADIPGLIEGAHQGKGLGLQFLRHVERTRMLIYLIDPIEDDPVKTWQVLKNELAEYSRELPAKSALLLLTKKDAWQENHLQQVKTAFELPVLAVSGISGEGLDELKWFIWSHLQELEKASTAGSESEIG